MRHSMVTKPSNCKALTKELIFTKTRNDNMFGIKNLNLWGNDLQDLSLIRQMPNLQVISLSVNNIKTLKHFQNCFKLQELYLRKNDIKLLNEIQYLQNLPQLRVLWLCDNPCANAKNYRQIIVKNLPGLTKLDNDVITQNERIQYGMKEQQNQQDEQQNEGKNFIMQNENNFQSNNPKKNNFLSQLQQNQSHLYPVNKNLSQIRHQSQRSNDSPLKILNKNKKSISHNAEQLLIKANQQTPSNQKMTKKQQKQYDQHTHFQHFEHVGSNNKHQNGNNRFTKNDIIGQNRSSINQGVRHYNEENTPKGQKQIPSYNHQFVKNPITKNQSNISHQKKSVNENYEMQNYESITKPNIYIQQSPQQKVVNSQTLANKERSIAKGSSPNIIMAIMSLLDDLDEDGLEIIKRETQKKLIEKRNQQKVIQSSVLKQYKRA